MLRRESAVHAVDFDPQIGLRGRRRGADASAPGIAIGGWRQSRAREGGQRRALGPALGGSGAVR
jgi:hypothetical protein